jgi:hypothetical protein
MPRVKPKNEEVLDQHPKQRTLPQNSALHLFCTQLADTLNDMGLDQRKVLKPSINIPWTKQAVKDMIWRPIQEAMYRTNSTTFLQKQGQIEMIHKVIMRELGEKHEVEFIPFPTSDVDKETAPLK